MVTFHDSRFSVLPLVYIHLGGVFVVGDNSALLNVLSHIYNHHIIAACDCKKQSKVRFLAISMRVNKIVDDKFVISAHICRFCSGTSLSQGMD